MKIPQKTPNTKLTSTPKIICYTGSYKRIILSYAIRELTRSLPSNTHLLILTSPSITHWAKIIPPETKHQTRILPLPNIQDLLHHNLTLTSLLSPRTQALLFSYPFEILTDGAIQNAPNQSSNSLSTPRIIGFFLATLKAFQHPTPLTIGLTYDTSSRGGKQSPWILKLLETYHIPTINIDTLFNNEDPLHSTIDFSPQSDILEEQDTPQDRGF